MPKRPRPPSKRAKPPPTSSAPPASDAPSAESPREQTFDDWKKSLTPTERRIEEILDLMTTGNWSRGISDKALAQRWQVSPSYVRTLSAEASRILKREVREDADFKAERKAQLIILFGAITHRAMRMNSPNGLRVALEAAQTQGLYLGIAPAKNVHVTGDSDEFDKLSDDELEAYSKGEQPVGSMN